MDFDFAFFGKAALEGVKALPVTFEIAILPIIFGTVFGLPIALVRFFRIRFLSPLFKWLVTFIRGIPVVLILLIFYLVTAHTYDDIMQSLHLPFQFKDLSKSLVAVAALTVASTAALSEVYRGSLAAIKKGQFDASYAVGLTKMQTLRRIILPQVVPVTLPMLCNVIIGFIKAASLASMVSVVDVLQGSLIAATENYRYLEAYVAAAVVYWAISVIIERGFLVIERHTGLKIREAKV
ncbi:L-cystine transport system permease protein TcyM [Clostridia bacterium]|nr:L-cystine transport system permease protein TcyM [Clostridia bacterium]